MRSGDVRSDRVRRTGRRRRPTRAAGDPCEPLDRGGGGWPAVGRGGCRLLMMVALVILTSLQQPRSISRGWLN